MNPQEPDQIDQIIGSIKTREDFAKFVNTLLKFREENPTLWLNNTLGSYLNGIEMFSYDLEGYYKNKSIPLPSQPSWKMFAEVLRAAVIYDND